MISRKKRAKNFRSGKNCDIKAIISLSVERQQICSAGSREDADRIRARAMPGCGLRLQGRRHRQGRVRGSTTVKTASKFRRANWGRADKVNSPLGWVRLNLRYCFRVV